MDLLSLVHTGIEVQVDKMSPSTKSREVRRQCGRAISHTARKTPTCFGLAMGSYGETGVMDFGLYHAYVILIIVVIIIVYLHRTKQLW